VSRVTSADVARASGVSRTTVSYVLNDTPGSSISETTRRRVLDAAERLGYTPSAAARTLRSGRSDVVLCVVPDWTAGPVIDTLIDDLTTLFARHGLSLLVFNDRGSQPLTELWRAVTPRAVLALGPLTDADAAAMHAARIPVVGSALDEDPHPETFAVPQHGIAELQVEHLAARGHRVLAYAAPSDVRLAAFAERRIAGARAACARLGLPEPRVRTVELEVDAAADAVRDWRGGDPVTAVVAYNDEVAFAVLAGLRTEGLRSPEDVAVIGVDDIPLARLASPALTSVWQAIDAQAEHLASSVLAALGYPVSQPRPTAELFHVVARAST
jgi:DNA-binding LacI/PurR family transcriptional regulator